MTLRRMVIAGTIVSSVTLSAAACGGSGSPATTATTAPALSLCQDVSQLRATLDSLTPVKGGVPTSTQLNTAATDIRSSLAGLGNRTEWQTQIDNLDAAVTRMQSAADTLAASPGAGSSAANARTAVAQVNDAIGRLLTAVGSRCPSASPTAAS